MSSVSLVGVLWVGGLSLLSVLSFCCLFSAFVVCLGLSCSVGRIVCSSISFFVCLICQASLSVFLFFCCFLFSISLVKSQSLCWICCLVVVAIWGREGVSTVILILLLFSLRSFVTVRMSLSVVSSFCLILSSWVPL